MDGAVLLVERADGIARLTLNRPDKGNAIDMPLARALAEAASVVAGDPAIRCVVLTGAGRLFCTGGDVAAFVAAPEGAGPFIGALATTLHGAMLTLATMAKPLVVLVNGPAAGAGYGLALLGDMVLAGKSAHFTPAYPAIGLTADGGLSWLLPRLIGLRAAQEVMLTNRRIGADEAATLGLVTRTVDDAALAEEGAALAARLAAAPVAALSAIRTLLAQGATATLSDQFAREATSMAAAAAGPEGQEGVAAFLARRPPVFNGA